MAFFLRLPNKDLIEFQSAPYIDSWVEPNFSRCFQLMECDDARLFQEWALQWRGMGVTLEIVPVVTSKETREVVAPHLGI